MPAAASKAGAAWAANSETAGVATSTALVTSAWVGPWPAEMRAARDRTSSSALDRTIVLGVPADDALPAAAPAGRASTSFACQDAVLNMLFSPAPVPAAFASAALASISAGVAHVILSGESWTRALNSGLDQKGWKS